MNSWQVTDTKSFEKMAVKERVEVFCATYETDNLQRHNGLEVEGIESIWF